jgi:hypothetical protein
MRALWLLVAAVFAARAAGEAGPKLAWDLKLAAVASEPSRAGQDIRSMRFSPDGKWIAAVTSRITTEGTRNEILLIPGNGNAAGVKRFPVNREILSTPERAGVHWSPESDYLAIETKMFSTTIMQVSGEGRCDLPRTTVFGGFVGPQLVIAADWEAPSDPASLPIDSSTLTLYGIDCSVKQTWKVLGHIRDVEPSALTGVVALSPEQSDIRLVAARADAGAEVAHVSERSGSMLRFGEKGSVLCKADYGARGTLVCHDLKTGGRFVHPEVVGGAPFDVSLESSVVLALEGSYEYDPLTGADHRGFSRWIVWDYRTGRDLGRLGYRGQRHSYAVSPAAIAPDGKRFVIGAKGELRMYDIPGRS